MKLREISKSVGQYTLVLLLLLAALIVGPFFERMPVGRLLVGGWCLIVITVLVFSILKQGRGRRCLVMTGAMLFIAISVYVLNEAASFQLPAVGLLTLGLLVLFLASCIGIILSNIFNEKLFTSDLMSGAILAYILLGIAWGAMNSFAEAVAPGSYSFAHELDIEQKTSALLYHSFVTLTTLGYGDILPLSQFARTSAYLEAVAGVMYCAILVAGLVSNIGRKHQ